MRNLKIVSAFVLFVLSFSLVAAGNVSVPSPNIVSSPDVSYDLTSESLTTRSAGFVNQKTTTDLSTKFGNGILSWIASEDNADLIPKINNEYSIMMFVKGENALNNLITPLGYFEIGNTGLFWVHTTVPNLKAVYTLASQSSVLMIDTDAKNDAYKERGQDLYSSLYSTRESLMTHEPKSVNLDSIPGGGAVTRNTTGVDYVNQTFGFQGEGVIIHVDDVGTDFGHTALRGTMALNSQGESVALDLTGSNIALSALFTREIYLDAGQTATAAQYDPLHSDGDGYIDLSGMDNLRIYDAFTDRIVKPNDFKLPWLDSFDLPDSYYVGSLPGNETGYVFGMASTLNNGLPQLVPFLLADGNNDDDFESLYIDYDTVELATLMYFGFPEATPEVFLEESDFDFTKYPAHSNIANQYLSADTKYNDGFYDVSVGAIGNTMDVNNVTGKLNGNESPMVNGIDPSGQYFAFMSANLGSHGTWTAANAVSNPMTYIGPDDTNAFITAGVAPKAKLLATSGQTSVTLVYSHLWASGFEAINSTRWEYTGHVHANVSSNSYGFTLSEVSGQFMGSDLFTIMVDIMAPAGILHPDHPGLLMLFSAGNYGNGYSSTGSPVNNLGLLVGASTSFELSGGWAINFGAIDGNQETAADGGVDEMVFFSSPGPTSTAYPKVDIVANGFVDFSTEPVHAIDDNQNNSVGIWSGTSASSPNAAGVLALIYQAWSIEYGTNLDAGMAKAILKGTAVDLGYDFYRQGAGRVDAKRAVHYILNGSLPDGEDLLIAHTPDSVSILSDRLTNSFLDRFGLGTNDNYLENLESNINPYDSARIDSSAYGGTINPGSTETLTFTINGTAVSADAFYYGTDHVETTPMLSSTNAYEFDGLYGLFDNTALDNADLAEITISLSDESYEDRGGQSIFIVQHFDNNSDGFISFDELTINNIFGRGYQTQTMQLSPRLLDSSTYILLANNDTEVTTPLEYTYSIRTFVETVESDITLTDIGGSQYTVDISPGINAEAGFREGFVRFNAANGTSLVPFSYSVAKLVGDYSTNGFTVVNQLLERPYDNAFISANQETPTQVDWDFRYLDFTLENAVTANTLAFEISSQYEETQIVAWVADADGYFIIDPVYEVNSPPNTIQLLVNITDYRLGDTLSGEDLTGEYDTFRLIMRTSAYSSDALPLDEFTVKTAWVPETLGDFAVPTPSLITAGSDTYDGVPATSSNIGVTWSTVSGNPIPTFNSTSSDLLVSVGAGVAVNLDQTIAAANLVPYGSGPMTPEVTIDVDLIAGMEVTAFLEWPNTATDFDFILIPKGGVYDFGPHDVMGSQMSTGANPEQGIAIVPATGTYEIVIEWFSGPVVDQDFHFEFIASLPLETIELEDTLSYTIDLTTLGIADAFYTLSSSINGWNFENTFTSRFLFDTGGPAVTPQTSIAENAVGIVTIATINDAIPYDYTLTKDGTVLKSPTGVNGPVSITVDQSVIEGILVPNEFVVTAEDDLGKSTTTTFSIFRTDRTPPVVVESPGEEVTGYTDTPFSLTFVVDDAQSGTYDATIFGQTVAEGNWSPNVDTVITFSVDEAGEYLFQVVFTDGEGLFTRARLSLIVIAETTPGATTSTDDGAFSSMQVIIFSALFVTLVRSRKYVR